LRLSKPAQEVRTVEAARLQIAAHEAAQAPIGADRAVGVAKRGESWRPFDVREEGAALFFGVAGSRGFA
jgi:hypothetical protein